MSETNIRQWKLANKIYGQLIDLTVSDALLQLNQMTELDDEVKRLVLTLISSGSQSSQYFNQQIGSSFQHDTWQNINLCIGDEIDGYELLEELGSGGMAKVFKAKKISADSQKPVAIKLFNLSGLSPVLLNRFTVEQEILYGLSHPHIVNMHHGGTSEKGIPFIVMELIDEAVEVDQYVKQQRASTRKIIRLMVAAARAIAHAHNNLVVHRDIKPSNLLIDKDGQLKVVDFGIAKLMGRENTPQKTTIMALTPSFAAPEQINSGHISVSTDVFGLAAVCLSLLIGESPLPKDRLLKSCVDDENHIWQTLRQIKDKDLRNILNQALQQQPNKRYRNMDLLADDLESWLAHKPVMATRDSWVYRITKFAQRRSALFASIMTLVVMSVFGISLLAWQTEKTRQQALNANEVKDFMLSVFSVVDPDEAQGENILAKDLLSQASNEINQQTFADSSIKSELLTAIGTAQMQLGLYHDAKNAFQNAIVFNENEIDPQLGLIKLHLVESNFHTAKEKLHKLKEMIPNDSIDYAHWKLLQSKVLLHGKEFERAAALSKQAHDTFLDNQMPKAVLTAARQQAEIMYLQSNPQQAAAYLEQALIYGLQELALTNTQVLGVRNDLVELYNDFGAYEKALKHSEQLIENIKTVLGDQHPFLIQSYISHAGTNRATGNIPQAEVNAELALELANKTYGLNHEITARALNIKAVLTYVKGDIPAALEQMKTVSKIYDQTLGEEHPDSWEIKTNLTALLNISKQFDEAIDIAEPLLEKQTEVLGKTHKSTIYTQTILARLYADVGRLQEAHSIGNDMLDNAHQNLGADHPLTIGGHFTMAKIFQRQGSFSQAIDMLEQVIRLDSWKEDNERVITAYNTLADLYKENNQLDEAIEYKQKSLSVAINLLNENSPKAVTQMLKNTQFYMDIGQVNEAKKMLLQVGGILQKDEKLATIFQVMYDELQQAVSQFNQ
jgi:serine/threonine protein kinase